MGPQPGNQAAPCSFRALGASEIRTLYTLAGPSLFGLDPQAPCHLFRSLSHSILRSDSSGAAWVSAFVDNSTSPVRTGPVVFSPVVPGGTGQVFFYDQGANNGVFFSPDDGGTWQQRDGNLYAAGGAGPTSGIAAFAVAPSNPNFVYLAGGGAGETLMYSSTDGGNTWTAVQAPTQDITTLTVDPTDPYKVFAAGGAPSTTTAQVYGSTGGTPPNLVWESTNAGNSWTSQPGPTDGPPLQLLATHPPEGLRLLATTVASNGAGRTFYHSTNGGAWLPVTVALGVASASAVAFNPARPDEMVIAVGGQQAGANGLGLLASYDGFETTAYFKFIPTTSRVVAIQAAADTRGDFFVQRTAGQEDSVYAFRTSALIPPPIHASLPEQQPVKVCPLHALPPPGPTQNPWVYDSGAIAYDGHYLVYTQDTERAGTNPLNLTGNTSTPKAPGVLYRVDPATCSEAPPLTVRNSQGNPIDIHELAYDPRYVLASGAQGAILAEGGVTEDPAIPKDRAPVYALDPVTGRQELAFTAYCTDQQSGTCFAHDPNVLAYDPYQDNVWTTVPDPDLGAGFSSAQLPSRRGAPAVPIPTCLSKYHVPQSIGSPLPYLSTMAFGSQDIAYFQLEDDFTVVRVQMSNCRTLGGFIHATYTEGDDEDDQMACDPVTFGIGSPHRIGTGTSVLWIRNVHDPKQGQVDYNNQLITARGNTVAAYPIPDGYCPFPTLMSFDSQGTVTAGTTQTVCATLVSAAAGTHVPLGGQEVDFELGTTIVARVTTDASGRACATLALARDAGGLPLTALFAGNQAYLPSRAAGPSVLAAVVARSFSNPPPRFVQPNPPQPLPPATVPAPPAAAQGAQQQTVQQLTGQTQPSMMTERQKQARVVAQLINGDRQEGLLASRATVPAAALFELGAGALLGGAFLWLGESWLRRRFRPRPAALRQRGREARR